jgi:molybdenum cofactor biosynthesis enzyme MoaA
MTVPARPAPQPPARLPEPVSFSLRASVSATCNMDCAYCPRSTSMEDYTPDIYRGRGVGHDGYCQVLTGLLSALRFSAVSLTGGEPLTNPRLPEIVERVRPLARRLELNTNGLLLTQERWQRLAPLVDMVKISLDTLDEHLFKHVTQAAGRNPLQRVLQAVEIIADSGVELALNCVVSRDTISTLDELIAFAIDHGVRLHLLDYYFTEERRANWQCQFIPIESVMPRLQRRFGPPEAQPIFGCGFYSYDAGGTVVRVKTSYSGTMRAPRCAMCSHYCQEGVYGLKLSTDTWATTCPSNELEDGVLLQPEMSPAQIHATLAPLLADLRDAAHQPKSMQAMIIRRNLQLDRDQSMPSPVHGSSTSGRR